ncbi:hypothetical protein FNV43_RR04303 [Rhamnella rubrinervis]|uniref:Enoyl reductase (ER) domain-containing protein n=1 Tax=Rhamnella rubrinervis TaxID=2594499 RepID=A0A8K0MPN4_9ROSA|nr:hypothetical protein FNV43_RR04303 [Rhamnella rubrinervis]
MAEIGSIISNKQVILKHYVAAGSAIKESDMYVTTTSITLKLPEGSNALLIKTLYLSCDPFLQFIMKNTPGLTGYTFFSPGSPICGYGVAKVLESGRPEFKKDDLVWGLMGWEEYSLVTNSQSFSKSTTLMYHSPTIQGFLNEVSRLKKGEYVFVSAASGAVGQLVGQFAKLAGCYVVGSAGSEEKVDMLKNKLGFDEAFNYKLEDEDLDAALKRYFSEGIDYYFEQVGGKMLDAVLLNMRNHGRIVTCGMISQYNVPQPHGIVNLMLVGLKRLQILGFTHRDHDHVYNNFLDFVLPLIRNKKITYVEDIAHGLDNAPTALAGLFTGRNFGKQLVAVAPHDHHY